MVVPAGTTVCPMRPRASLDVIQSVNTSEVHRHCMGVTMDCTLAAWRSSNAGNIYLVVNITDDRQLEALGVGVIATAPYNEGF